jgi:hypothetical protein
MSKQSERLARQMAKGMLDFSASEKCIATATPKWIARKVYTRVLNSQIEPQEIGRLLPPHVSGSGFSNSVQLKKYR